MRKNKKSYKRILKKKAMLRAYAEPRYNSLLSSHINPFFTTKKRLPPKRINVSNLANMRFLSGLKRDSALNPFTLFQSNKLSKVSKSNMTWDQAKRKFPKMNPFGDADGDGIENWMDCRPLNKYKQGPGPGHQKKPKMSKEDRIISRWVKKQQQNRPVKSDLQTTVSKMREQEKKLDLAKRNMDAVTLTPSQKKQYLEVEELIKKGEKIKEGDSRLAAYAKGKNLENLPPEVLEREQKISQYGIVKEGGKLAARERGVDRALKTAARYEKVGEYLGGVPGYQVEEGGKLLTQGAKNMMKRQDTKWDVATAKSKKTTLGILGALTTSGGMIEDGADDYIGIGTSGGLSRVRQKARQTRGKVGRPAGSYKYGAPVQVIKERQRLRKQQLAMQQLAAEQRMMEVQAQQIQRQQPQPQQYQPQPQQYQSQPQAQPQYQEQPYNEQATLDQMSAGSQGFVTPEMSDQPQPQPYYQQQPQAPNSFQPQGRVPQAMPGSRIPEWSKIEQPKNRGNPWNLIAKWRPNFSQNTFKSTPQAPKPNLLTNAKQLLTSTRPATTTSRLTDVNPGPPRGVDTTVTNTYTYNVTPAKRQNPQMGGDS
jgi:hypothetical protein